MVQQSNRVKTKRQLLDESFQIKYLQIHQDYLEHLQDLNEEFQQALMDLHRDHQQKITDPDTTYLHDAKGDLWIRRRPHKIGGTQLFVKVIKDSEEFNGKDTKEERRERTESNS